MVAETMGAPAQEEVAAAKAELRQIFGAMGGVTARAAEFSRVVPRCPADVVTAALEELVAEGVVEAASLADGTLIYQFIRH
jgi:hypothetical protein